MSRSGLPSSGDVESLIKGIFLVVFDNGVVEDRGSIEKRRTLLRAWGFQWRWRRGVFELGGGESSDAGWFDPPIEELESQLPLPLDISEEIVQDIRIHRPILRQKLDKSTGRHTPTPTPIHIPIDF